VIAEAVSTLLIHARTLVPFDSYTPSEVDDAAFQDPMCASFDRCRAFVRRFASTASRARFESAWESGSDPDAICRALGWEAPPRHGVLHWETASISSRALEAMLARGEVDRVRAMVWCAEMASSPCGFSIRDGAEAGVVLWRHDAPDLRSAVDAAMLYGEGEFVTAGFAERLNGGLSLDRFSLESAGRHSYCGWRLRDWRENASDLARPNPRVLAEVFVLDMIEDRRDRAIWHRMGVGSMLHRIDRIAFVEHLFRCVLGLQERPDPSPHLVRDLPGVLDAIRSAEWDSRQLDKIDRLVEDWTALLESDAFSRRLKPSPKDSVR
jgi:hypothetical protein